MTSVNTYNVLTYVSAFFGVFLPLTLSIHNVILDFMTPLEIQYGTMYKDIFAYSAMFLLIFPMCLNKRRDLVWWFLASLHGIAHIVHPAFHGTTPNVEYTPLWDFIIHALECLCIHMYHRTQSSYYLSYTFYFTTLLAGITAHVYGQEFMATTPWLILSGGGVLGATYHMNMLNDGQQHYSKSLLAANFIVWFAPYLGYLNFDWIPYWDNAMNEYGLFQMWFLAWFLTTKFVNGFLR